MSDDIELGDKQLSVRYFVSKIAGSVLCFLVRIEEKGTDNRLTAEFTMHGELEGLWNRGFDFDFADKLEDKLLNDEAVEYYLEDVVLKMHERLEELVLGLKPATEIAHGEDAGRKIIEVYCGDYEM